MHEVLSFPVHVLEFVLWRGQKIGELVRFWGHRKAAMDMIGVDLVLFCLAL